MKSSSEWQTARCKEHRAVRLLRPEFGKNSCGDDMKDALKIAAITIVGLFIAVIVYPFVHEVGHSLAAVIVGAKVEEFNLYPLPNVLCSVQSVGTKGLVVIGMSGMLLPFLLTAIIQPQKFWSWYICFTMRGICLLSFAISLCSIIVFQTELKMVNEDITQVMQFAPNLSGLYLSILLGLVAWDTLLLIKSHTFQHCMEFFELKKTES